MTRNKGNMLLPLLAALAFLAVVVGGYYYWKQTTVPPKALTWEQCLKIPDAKILTTYPGQCVTPDGRKVVQPLSPEEQKKLHPPKDTNEVNYSSTISGKILIYKMSRSTMTVQLIAESTAGNIKDMRVWTNTQSSDQWLPFKSVVTLPIADTVYVQFRDEQGDISKIYSDTSSPPQGPPPVTQ